MSFRAQPEIATSWRPSHRWQSTLTASRISLLRRSQTMLAVMPSLSTSMERNARLSWTTSSHSTRSVTDGPSLDPAEMTVTTKSGHSFSRRPGQRSLAVTSALRGAQLVRPCIRCLGSQTDALYTITCGGHKSFGIKYLLLVSASTRWPRLWHLRPKLISLNQLS